MAGPVHIDINMIEVQLLATEMSAVPAKADAQARAIMITSADAVQNRMVEYIYGQAYDTGGLARSIEVRNIDPLTYRIGAFGKEGWYGHFIENGTVGVGPRPYAHPAARDIQPVVARAFNEMKLL